MLERGHRFVVPAMTSYKAVKTLLTRFKNAKEKTSMVYSEHAYSVWKTDIDLRKSKRESVDGSSTYEMTVADEEGHGLSGLLTAYICYDSKKYSDEVHDRELLIESLQEFARNMDDADPVKAFMKLAGKAAKYFEIAADGRKVALVEKNTRYFQRQQSWIVRDAMLPGRVLGVHDGRLRCKKAHRTGLRHREIIRSQAQDRRADHSSRPVFHPVRSADPAR